MTSWHRRGRPGGRAALKIVGRTAGLAVAAALLATGASTLSMADELETDLTEAQERRYVERVLDSELGDHVVSEINFARFVTGRFVRGQEECLELIDELETYRTSLQ